MTTVSLRFSRLTGVSLIPDWCGRLAAGLIHRLCADFALGIRINQSCTSTYRNLALTRVTNPAASRFSRLRSSTPRPCRSDGALVSVTIDTAAGETGGRPVKGKGPTNAGRAILISHGRRAQTIHSDHGEQTVGV